MKKVIIASKNPVKIKAVQKAFDKMMSVGDVEFVGTSVDSGVGDQPMSDEETLLGATNRARNAQLAMPEADYWVGIEGGIQEQGDQMMAFAWIVLLSEVQKGQARTGAFFLPPEVSRLVKAGKELGEADDIVFGHSNSKQQGGAIGLLTNNVMDRTSLYVDAVMMALIPFRNVDLY